MNVSDFEARLRAVLSHLSEHLTDAQFEHAVAHAADITGITMPTSDPEKVEALLNRGEAFCLEMLQNDWLPRFDMTYDGDSLSRADVARQIGRKLARLDKRWAVLSERYKSDVDRGSLAIPVGTAYRV